MRQGEHGRDQTTQCLAGHRKGRDHSRCHKGRHWKILNMELTWETSGGKEKNKSQLRYHVLSAPARSRRRLKVWNRAGRWRPARPADRRSVLRSVNGASSRISLRRRVAAERSQPPGVHAAERSQLLRGARGGEVPAAPGCTHPRTRWVATETDRDRELQTGRNLRAGKSRYEEDETCGPARTVGGADPAVRGQTPRAAGCLPPPHATPVQSQARRSCPALPPANTRSGETVKREARFV